MEIAALATTAISSLATAGSTAAAGISSFASAAGGASSLATLFQGGASAVSALSSLASGNATASNNEMQIKSLLASSERQREVSEFSALLTRDSYALEAASVEEEARREFILGKQRTAAIKEELARVVGGQLVAYAAAGVDPTRGTARAQQDGARSAAQSDIDTNNAETKFHAAQLRLKAAQIRLKGQLTEYQYRAQAEEAAAQTGEAVAQLGRNADNARAGGMLEALGTGASFFADALRRK